MDKRNFLAAALGSAALPSLVHAAGEGASGSPALKRSACAKMAQSSMSH